MTQGRTRLFPTVRRSSILALHTGAFQRRRAVPLRKRPLLGTGVQRKPRLTAMSSDSAYARSACKVLATWLCLTPPAHGRRGYEQVFDVFAAMRRYTMSSGTLWPGWRCQTRTASLMRYAPEDGMATTQDATDESPDLWLAAVSSRAFYSSLEFRLRRNLGTGCLKAHNPVPDDAWEYQIRKSLNDAAYNGLQYVPYCSTMPVQVKCDEPKFMWVGLP